MEVEYKWKTVSSYFYSQDAKDRKKGKKKEKKGGCYLKSKYGGPVIHIISSTSK